MFSEKSCSSLFHDYETLIVYSNFSNRENLSSAGDQLLNIPNLPGSSLEFVKRNSIAIICWIFSKVTCMQTVWIFRKMFRFHHLSHLNVGYLFYYRRILNRILNSEIIREWRVWKLKTESHLSITGPTTFLWELSMHKSGICP